MRRTVPIILLVLGVLCAVVGVGRLTFWGPPETLTAHTEAGKNKAPLTMLTQSVNDLTGDGAELTVHAKGPFRAVVGRASDVEAWVGDASATVIKGVDQDEESFDLERRPGREEAPDPKGSDLWVVDQQHRGEWKATWASDESQDEDSFSPGSEGDWTLLLATDGKSAAPADLSLTWDNPDATMGAKFATAVWWFVGALVLIVIALVLMTRRPRRRSRHGATYRADSPRRAAREERTGKLPVVAPVPPAAQEDDDATEPAGPPAAPHPAGDDLDDDDFIATLGLNPAAFPKRAPGEDETDEGQEDFVDEDDFDLPGGDADDFGGDGRGPGRRPGRGPGSRFGRGLGVGLASLALVVPTAPAWAASDAPEKGKSEQATPVLVESQLNRIMGQVSTTQAEGDKARKASKLSSRFAGQALKLRKSYYSNVKKGVRDASAVPAIAAEPIRAAAVTTSPEWPRTMMVVTQGKKQPYPVIATLEQESPRSNYHVVQSVPMVAEAKLPGVTLGSPEVETQTADQEGLAAKPSEAVDGLADVLKNSKSKWAKRFDSSVFVDVWQQGAASMRKQLKKADPDARFDTSFSVDSSATKVLASPQGGSYVSGDLTITTVTTPSRGGTMELPGDAKKLAGEASTSKKVVTSYHVPVFLYIPASGDGKIRVIGATQQIKGIELK